MLTRCQEHDRSRPALPWAMAIAGWECRTLAKKRLRRRELPEEHAADLASGFEEELAHQQLLSAAVSSLGELSESERAALVATFWEEAASAQGATLRKRRERALKRLRDTFKRLYGID